MLADARTPTLFAPAALLLVLTEAGCTAFLTAAADAPVLADASSPAFFATTPNFPVATDPPPATLLAAIALPPMLADTASSALFAGVTLSTMFAVFVLRRVEQFHLLIFIPFGTALALAGSFGTLRDNDCHYQLQVCSSCCLSHRGW